MNKIYARQVNPEYQESPLFIEGCFPDDIICDGNRHYISHTTREYDEIIERFDEMAWEWENCHYCTLAEILQSYGLERNDGKPWSTQQRGKWRKLFESGHDADDDEIILSALELITGRKWESHTISGCCQGDWQNIIVPETWSREDVRIFESEYFNLGSEWCIHDSDGVVESADDIEGFYMYCHGYGEDEIKAEIAACVGGNPADVVLYTFTGYQRIELYEAC